MPRQPYLPTYRQSGWGLGLDVIDQLPGFTSAIGRCIARWSFVEHQLAVLLGVLMKAQDDVAIAVFTKLRRGSLHREALEVAAIKTLPDEQVDLLRAILSIVKTSEKERAELAHGHWGRIEGRTDKALWIASEHHSSWNAGVLNGRTDAIEELTKHMFVFDIRDIEDIHSRIYDCWMMLFDFTLLIRNPVGTGISNRQGGNLYETLTSLPRLREPLARGRAAAG